MDMKGGGSVREQDYGFRLLTRENGSVFNRKLQEVVAAMQVQFG